MSCERILTKFLGGVGHGPGTNDFNFGDDLDQHPDPGVRSPKSEFTGLSIMLAFGGGLRSLNTSSWSTEVRITSIVDRRRRGQNYITSSCLDLADGAVFVLFV